MNQSYLKIALVFIFSLTAGYYLVSSKKNPSAENLPIHQHNEEKDAHSHEEEKFIALTEKQIEDLGIQTQIAGPGEIVKNISTRGKIILHPDKLVHILPRISGVAKEAFKNIGDHVKEGEILAVLESHEMADIKANFLAAKEKEILALSLLQREKRLFEKKVTAEQDYLNAKSAYVEASINFQLASQKLRAFGMTDEEIENISKNQGQDLRLYEILSPLNGTVIARHINKGEFIENTVTIYEIADLSTVWIEIGIYPKDLVNVQEGQMIETVLPLNGNKAQARIIYLSPIIQEETITAKAIAALQNTDGNWRPGTFVKVNIAMKEISFPIVIPKEAIQEMEGKPYIFVKVPEGFEKREVKLGVNDQEHVEILSGLEKDEKYASSNTFLLKADLGKKEAEHEH